MKNLLKKLARKRIILLALSATGVGAYFNPEAVALVIEVVQVLAE